MEKGISICVKLVGKYVLYVVAFWITYEWFLAEALNLVERPNVHFYLLFPALIVAGETLTYYIFDRYGLQWIKPIWTNRIVEGTARNRKRWLALLFFGGLIFVILSTAITYFVFSLFFSRQDVLTIFFCGFLLTVTTVVLLVVLLLYLYKKMFDIELLAFRTEKKAFQAYGVSERAIPKYLIVETSEPHHVPSLVEITVRTPLSLGVIKAKKIVADCIETHREKYRGILIRIRDKNHRGFRGGYVGAGTGADRIAKHLEKETGYPLGPAEERTGADSAVYFFFKEENEM